MTKFFTLAILLLSIEVLAQLPMVPGYIVTQEGDTIMGDIRDLQWLSSPNQIEFRPANGETSVKSAKAIRAFSITGKRDYVAFTFKFDGDMLGQHFTYPNQVTPAFPRSRLPVKWIERNCFLDVIVQGTYSLFKFMDEEKRIHFFIQTPGSQTVEELQYHEYLAYGTTLNISQYFKFQLQSITKDCPNLQKSIVELKYEQKALAGIIERINQCKGGRLPTGLNSFPENENLRLVPL